MSLGCALMLYPYYRFIMHYQLHPANPVAHQISYGFPWGSLQNQVSLKNTRDICTFEPNGTFGTSSKIFGCLRGFAFKISIGQNLLNVGWSRYIIYCMSLYVYVVFCLPGCVLVWVFALFICLFAGLFSCLFGCLIYWLIDWRPFACLFIYLLVVCFLFMFHEHLNLCCFCVLFRMIWRIINESMWHEIPGTTSTCHLAGRPPQVLDKQEDKGMVEGRWCTVEAQCFFCISHGIRIVNETCAKMRLLQQDAWKLVNPNCKR